MYMDGIELFNLFPILCPVPAAAAGVRLPQLRLGFAD